MKAFLRGVGLWHYVKEEKQPPPLGPNPTLNQIRQHEEDVTKTPRALSSLHQGVTDVVFTKIVACETVKELTLSEVVNALKVEDQRRALRRQEENIEGVFSAKTNEKKSNNSPHKKFFGEKKEKWKQAGSESQKSGDKKGRYQPCPHCKKRGHSPNFCWHKPNAKCRICNQFGHVDKVYKSKESSSFQQSQQVQEVEKQNETSEHLFVVSNCDTTEEHSTWLIDSGCSNHMTYEQRSIGEA
ncbi:uncharacterized protein LOC123213584 [Mangifera indica]|uniref:uncharacterized protein LOC123213584 n=1 Tax=Mangifera indica TaxID=29780 RepID=UPI001CFAE454|nr:uncharacterized protein LOC123213584 [Mangifera indica]